MQEICDIGDLSCSELWEKKEYGESWKCVENCGCHEEIYGTEANNLCRSLGDCGVHYNVVGGVSSEKSFRVTDNAPVTRKSKLFGGKKVF